MRQIMRKFFTTLLFTIPFFASLSAQAATDVETWRTDEGAEVYYLYAPEIPMVDLILSLEAGSIREGDSYGLAAMTAKMVTSGTQSLDEEALLLKLDQLQSSITASSSTYHTLFSLRSLSKASLLQPSLDLLYEMLQSPRFEEKVFKREITQAIDSQKARLDNPSAIANELYYAALYPNSVIGATSEMLQASLTKMSLGDVKAFQEQYYDAHGAKIIFVGDISEEDAKKVSAQISQILGPGEIHPAIAQIEPVSMNLTYEKYFNSPQTQVMMGQPAIDRFSPDYLPLMIGNHLLGGSGLTSLLMTTIREKEGLTYGIYSRFSPNFYEGPFTISFSTKNESVEDAITQTKAVVKQFIDNGPDPELLERAKNNYIGSLVLDLDSNLKLAYAILNLATYGLPLDYYETLPEKVRAITPQEIQEAFKRHVNPQEMTTVIVGGDVAPDTETETPFQDQ
ncbi:M16 family metallopeptidase [Ignatzschineria cameli]|nr:pitrilysin family protein [Ignatzschineria cameli]